MAAEPNLGLSQTGHAISWRQLSAPNLEFGTKEANGKLSCSKEPKKFRLLSLKGFLLSQCPPGWSTQYGADCAIIIGEGQG
jgi:hypothetical protein